MLKKLQNYLKSLIHYRATKLELISKTKKGLNNIPSFIDDNEKIIRSIFSPVNVNLKTNTLRTNTFKSPANIDEVSVNRLDFTNANFCKDLSKKIQNPDNKRSYFGLAVLIASEIRNLKADVVSSPILTPKENKNPYHADIKVGYVRAIGEELPAQASYIVQELSSKARFYQDLDPESAKWEGPELL